MKIMALDLEMNQPSEKIIEIGAVVGDTETGKIYERLSTFVNPEEALNPYIIDLTSITQRDVDNGVYLNEAYKILVELHKRHNCFCNPLTWGGGDSVTLKQQLGEFATPWIFGRRWIDAKTLYVSWRLANGSPIQGGLSKAMTKFGLAFAGKKHRAVDDAANTFLIYMAMLRKLKE